MKPMLTVKILDSIRAMQRLATLDAPGIGCGFTINLP